MSTLNEITQYLDSLLCPTKYQDYAFNGLQVEACQEIKKVSLAVDSGISVLEEAIRSGSQLLIVHHGINWGDSQPLTGAHGISVKLMMTQGLSLYASHLPLDGHDKIGNNVSLLSALGLELLSMGFDYKGIEIGALATNPKNLAVDEIAKNLLPLDSSGQIPHTLKFGPNIPRKIGIITGSGCDALAEAVRYGCDTFITGESKQSAFHYAKDHKLNCIFGGHYRTETLGVKNLGELLKNEFNVETAFIDIPTYI